MSSLVVCFLFLWGSLFSCEKTIADKALRVAFVFFFLLWLLLLLLLLLLLFLLLLVDGLV